MRLPWATTPLCGGGPTRVTFLSPPQPEMHCEIAHRPDRHTRSGINYHAGLIIQPVYFGDYSPLHFLLGCGMQSVSVYL